MLTQARAGRGGHGVLALATVTVTPLLIFEHSTRIINISVISQYTSVSDNDLVLSQQIIYSKDSFKTFKQ